MTDDGHLGEDVKVALDLGDMKGSIDLRSQTADNHQPRNTGATLVLDGRDEIDVLCLGKRTR